MNSKAGLLFISIAFFGFGIVTERFVFSSKQSTAGPKPNEYASEISSEDQGVDSPTEYLNDTNRSSDDINNDRKSSNSEQDRKDPIRQFLREIEHGHRIDFSNVSSLLDQLPSGNRRREYIERIASHWGNANPEAALAWANTLIQSEKLSAVGSIIHEWARNDPRSAADYVTQMPKSQRSLDWVYETARIWAQQDQPTAIGWGIKQPDLAIRERALRGAAAVWATTDSAAAAAFALGLENPYERHAVLETVARRWARQSTSESLEWALDLGGENRDRATMAILEEVAEHDPRQAASMFEEIVSALPKEDSRESIQSRIAWELAGRWSNSNPTEAAVWAIGLSESDDIQRGAVERVAEQWLRSDSMAASQWIAEIPEGPARDAAAGQVVRHISRSDQSAAFSWATSVSDEGYQTELMRDVLERWQTTDPIAARSAIESAEVTAEQREEFKKLFGSPVANSEQSEDPESK